MAELADLPAGRQARTSFKTKIMFVYAMTSINHSYIYVGMTKNISDRYNRHNSGREKTTKFYAPFDMLFLTWVADRSSARLVEKKLKSGSGKEFLKSLI